MSNATTTTTTTCTWHCDHCHTRNDILVNDCRWCGMDKQAMQQRQCHCNLTAAFAGLLHDTETCDIVFQVMDDVKFVAHKVVLAARSTYFRSMLYGGLRESGNNNNNNKKDDVIVLHDVTPIAFGNVLHYLYTGNPDKDLMTVDDTLDLLVTADLFQLDELQHVCEYRLAAQLTVHNLWPILHTSLVMVQVRHLRAAALEFVRHHRLEAEDVDAFVESCWNDSNIDIPLDIRAALQKAKKDVALPCSTSLVIGTDDTYAALQWAP